jgi:mannose-6-phosphate isomerase
VKSLWISYWKHIRKVCWVKNQGNNLPFLFKILAAAQPLSLQVHPDRQTAQYGFPKEEEARIPITDPNRIFKDPNPKPELICALTPFIAMCGFRPYEEIIRNFQILGIDNLWQALSSFQKKPCSKNLQELFNHILASEPLNWKQLSLLWKIVRIILAQNSGSPARFVNI